MSSNEEMNKLTAQELIKIKLAIAEHKQSMEIMQSQLLMLRANIDTLKNTVQRDFGALMNVKGDIELQQQDHETLSARVENLCNTIMSFSKDLHSSLFDSTERYNAKRERWAEDDSTKSEEEE